jgi:lactoylglutathione lyase
MLGTIFTKILMTMKIEHLTIWTENPEDMRDFYVKYFDMLCGEKYNNVQKRFSSYFLSFKDSDTRIELMNRPDISAHRNQKGLTNGLTHFAISVGSRDKVNSIAEWLTADDYTVQGEPRTTGDGYYESVVLDPEGNHIEITE